LGRLLMGQKIGQEVDFKTPGGAVMKIKIIEVK
jgi:transcription elongation GreA/GreB family factor